MKALITGGAGFIGSHIAEQLQGRAEIRVLDNLRSGFERNLNGLKCEFVRGSILDRPLVRRVMEGVDCVFHLAAFVSVPDSVKHPDECFEINSRGTLVVLEEATRAGVKRLVFSSSAAVYGDSAVVPKVETLPPEPKSPYATSKLEGETDCAQFTAEGRIQTVCLRYFNVFGPRQDPRSQYAAAVPAFVERALKNRPMVVFGDGQQTRDFINVQDIAAANVFFASESAAVGVFNVACGQSITINNLAATIRRLTSSKSEITHEPERAGDVKHSVASIEKIRAAGFITGHDFTEGLRATIEFFKAWAKV